jgi:hypothetical protein
VGLCFLGNPTLNWLAVGTYLAVYNDPEPVKGYSVPSIRPGDLRMMLSAGFIGNAYWSPTYRQPLIRAFWPQPVNPRWLFHNNDSYFLHIFAFAIHSLLLDGDSRLGS